MPLSCIAYLFIFVSPLSPAVLCYVQDNISERKMILLFSEICPAAAAEIYRAAPLTQEFFLLYKIKCFAVRPAFMTNSDE